MNCSFTTNEVSLWKNKIVVEKKTAKFRVGFGLGFELGFGWGLGLGQGGGVGGVT